MEELFAFSCMKIQKSFLIERLNKAISCLVNKNIVYSILTSAYTKLHRASHSLNFRHSLSKRQQQQQQLAARTTTKNDTSFVERSNSIFVCGALNHFDMFQLDQSESGCDVMWWIL